MIRIIDVETSGEEPDVDVVEVGWADIDGNTYSGFDIVWVDDDFSERMPYKSVLVNPGCAISPTASAIHHITDEDVRDAPKILDVLAHAFDATSETIYVAHYADSDKIALGPVAANRKWICTWKVAVTLAPKAPSWSLQALRYWLDLDVDRQFANPSHRAGPDAYVTAALLLRMLAKMSIEDMVGISAGPVFLPRFGFGKHAKEPIADIPTGYLDWVLRQRNDVGEFEFDKNVVHTCITEIERRQQNRRG